MDGNERTFNQHSWRQFLSAMSCHMFEVKELSLKAGILYQMVWQQRFKAPSELYLVTRQPI
jgi:hypothetical protein